MVVPGWYSILDLALLVSVVVVSVHCQYESGSHSVVFALIACAITVVLVLYFTHIMTFELLSWLW